MIKRLVLIALLALATFNTSGIAIDIPIPDCSPENCPPGN